MNSRTSFVSICIYLEVSVFQIQPWRACLVARGSPWKPFNHPVSASTGVEERAGCQARGSPRESPFPSWLRFQMSPGSVSPERRFFSPSSAPPPPVVVRGRAEPSWGQGLLGSTRCLWLLPVSCKVPSAGPVTKVENIGVRTVTITWKEIPKSQRNGFVSNYTIFYQAENGKEFCKCASSHVEKSPGP